ncbi:MAG: permease [Silicimonas sp.]|nr:permease [Silicimonas sp.]MBT8424202.1 permease [Silicimonas sp.]NND41769.1 permease [Silicimonas sp.]NNL34894.1 permease [Silicimonas sp.]NNL72265.1 permease [Silicimonas sp.]
MADVSHSQEPRWRFDRVWLFAAALPLVVAIFDPAQAVEMVRFALAALGHTGWFIAFAVLAVGYLKASGSEALLARAFEGREGRMIVMAALLGGLSPFCSCEVIPFIAALLAVGAPLSAVMAFWLASPLMDPAMFLITAGTLGLPFAVAKTMAAVGLGLLGGVTVYLFARSRVFADPLKIQSTKKSCSGSARSPFEGAPVWQFWTERPRREVFRDTVVDNALFLGKWLLLAYMIEALMLAYIPAETIATVLGGQGVWPVVLGALVGAPAYLNGYAAVPLVDALLAQGMANGAAMSFMLAGGVSCIPAAVAVWALVKPRVFAAYIGIAFAGSLMAGLAWGFAAG